MVQGILIPADNTAPLRTAALDSLEDYQRAVGGWFEAVDIPDLGITMRSTRTDSSATCPSTGAPHSLWRFHVPQARDARLVGDVELVGLTDDEGVNTALPNELARRLLEPGTYRVRTRELGRNRWHEEPIDRDDYVETVIWSTLLREMSPTLEVQIERVEGVEGEKNQP